MLHCMLQFYGDRTVENEKCCICQEKYSIFFLKQKCHKEHICHLLQAGQYMDWHTDKWIDRQQRTQENTTCMPAYAGDRQRIQLVAYWPDCVLKYENSLENNEVSKA